MKQLLSTVLELVAVVLIAALVAVVAAPIWALIPVAGYLLVASQVLARSGR